MSLVHVEHARFVLPLIFHIFNMFMLKQFHFSWALKHSDDPKMCQYLVMLLTIILELSCFFFFNFLGLHLIFTSIFSFNRCFGFLYKCKFCLFGRTAV